MTAAGPHRLCCYYAYGCFVTAAGAQEQITHVHAYMFRGNSLGGWDDVKRMGDGARILPAAVANRFGEPATHHASRIVIGKCHSAHVCEV